MTTNNVRDLAPGHGVYAFLLNAQGRIQADLYVFHRGDSLLVDTERAQRDKILELFDRYIIADDVEIADISDKLTAIGLTGPQSRARSGTRRYSRPRTRASTVRRCHLAAEGDHAFTFRRRSARILASLDCSRARRRTAGRAAQGRCATRGTTAFNLFRISRGDSAIWRRHPRPRSASGNRPDPSIKFHQRLLSRPGNRGAHSLPRCGPPAVHGIHS